MNYYSEEEIEQLREFQTPPKPMRRTRRKGSLRVAQLLDLLHDQGTTSVTVWDVESRLRALGKWDDLWGGVSPEGAAKLLGDLLGAHGLRLTSINGNRGAQRRYVIPADIEAHCQQHGVDLVDDPNRASDETKEVAGA